jgi:hypothetical protein
VSLNFSELEVTLSDLSQISNVTNAPTLYNVTGLSDDDLPDFSFDALDSTFDGLDKDVEGGVYTVTIKGPVTDVAGNQMISPSSATFLYDPYPPVIVSSVPPLNGFTDVVPQVFKIIFHENIQIVEPDFKISISDSSNTFTLPVPAFSVDPENTNTLLLDTGAVSFAEFNRRNENPSGYKVNVYGGLVSDAHGNVLGTDKEFNFTYVDTAEVSSRWEFEVNVPNVNAFSKFTWS